MWLLLLMMAMPVANGDPPWLVALDEAEELRRARRFAEAEPAYARALQLARRENAEDPGVAIVQNNTGFFLHQTGRTSEAERRYASAYRWFAAHRAQYATVLTRTVTNLGSLYAENGKLSKAEKLMKEWVDSHELTAPGQTEPADVARLRSALGAVLVRLRKYSEAEPLLAMARAALEREPHDELQRESVALAIGSQAGLYQETGRGALALAGYDQALAILSARPGNFPITLVHTLLGAAAARLQNQQPAEALALCRRAVEIGDAQLSPDLALLATAHAGYAALLRQMRQRGEAKEHERRARAIRERVEQRNGPEYTVDVHSLRGR